MGRRIADGDEGSQSFLLSHLLHSERMHIPDYQAVTLLHVLTTCVPEMCEYIDKTFISEEVAIVREVSLIRSRPDQNPATGKVRWFRTGARVSTDLGQFFFPCRHQRHDAVYNTTLFDIRGIGQGGKTGLMPSMI
jgi:hypothetical protein